MPQMYNKQQNQIYQSLIELKILKPIAGQPPKKLKY